MADPSATATHDAAPEPTPGEDVRPTLAPAGDVARGRVALVADSTLGPEAEFTAFVRRRVRQVSVLFLVGYVVFLGRELASPDRGAVRLPLIGFVLIIPLQLALVALMYSRWPAASYRRVRVVEWAGLALLCT